jgi:hypothetical protein
MKLSLPILLGSVLAMGCALPALANGVGSPQQYQNDQDRDRDRNTQAYNDGYAQGQADARGHAIRNDQPTAQWTKDDDMHAYRQGYDAGYENIMNGGREMHGDRDADHMASGDRQAEQFGYQDGLAAGRHDQMKGEKFKPADHDLYKDGTHGWTASLGTKDQFKQLYREGFMKGYQDGYQGTGPR